MIRKKKLTLTIRMGNDEYPDLARAMIAKQSSDADVITGANASTNIM